MFVNKLFFGICFLSILGILGQIQIGYTKCYSDLINIKKLSTTILLDIRYATSDNFLKEVLYSSKECYLRKEVAQSLINAENILNKQKLSVKIWDCYRPLSVQKKMWAIKPDSLYVANPYKGGSKHNRGTAVDLTLVSQKGELSMPTGFDDFSEKASHSYKKLSTEQIKNRSILRKAMELAGFKSLDSEWWHYDHINYKRYHIIDENFDSLAKCNN